MLAPNFAMSLTKPCFENLALLVAQRMSLFLVEHPVNVIGPFGGRHAKCVSSQGVAVPAMASRQIFNVAQGLGKDALGKGGGSGIERFGHGQ